MSAAEQVYSRDFDADFFRLPAEVRTRIESAIDRLGFNEQETEVTELFFFFSLFCRVQIQEDFCREGTQRPQR